MKIKKYFIKWFSEFRKRTAQEEIDYSVVMRDDSVFDLSLDFLDEPAANRISNNRIRKQIRDMRSADEATKKEKLLALGKEFLETAAWGDDLKIRVFVNTGFPVNHQDPKTGSTALHRAAACMARDVVRVLIKQNKCDFLIRDNKGRLPSEMAFLYGHDPALARLLGNKERKQAEKEGIKLTRRPPTEPKP